MAKYSAMTDEALVAQFCAGQNEAFDELLLRYKDRLYSYITFQVKNSDTADDLFQETFVKAIVHLRKGQYREQGTFYAWLTRITRNLLIDMYRREGSASFVYKDAQQDDWNDVVDYYELSRESELVYEQLQRDACQLMNELPSEQREIVYMRFYQNMSFKEIAEKTGMSINTALGRMYYAVRNLRKKAQAQHLCVM